MFNVSVWFGLIICALFHNGTPHYIFIYPTLSIEIYRHFFLSFSPPLQIIHTTCFHFIPLWSTPPSS